MQTESTVFTHIFVGIACLFKRNSLSLFMKQYYLLSLVKMNNIVFLLLTFPFLTGKHAEMTVTCPYKNVKILLLITKSKPNVTQNRKEVLDICGIFLSAYLTR